LAFCLKVVQRRALHDGENCNLLRDVKERFCQLTVSRELLGIRSPFAFHQSRVSVIPVVTIFDVPREQIDRSLDVVTRLIKMSSLPLTGPIRRSVVQLMDTLMA